MEKNKSLIKLVLGFIIFFFISYVAVIILRYGFNLNVLDYGKRGIALADALISSLVTILFIILYFDVIKSSWLQFKENYKKNISQIFLGIIIGYLVLNAMQIVASYVSALLFFICGVQMETAANQQTIEELLASAPLIMIFSSCILAPIEEELLFRGSIRKSIKNKKVFIACSGLIFGLMHVTDSIIFIGELLLLGVVIDRILSNNKLNKNDKTKLSVVAVVIILFIFAGIYYFTYGNLINAILSLPLKEVIGSVTYVIMGVTLASLYIYNKENILMNISIHALNNIVAIMLALFLK